MRRRVIGLVVRRGTPRHAADDVAQEVAVRAYRTRPTFSSADDLFWWCSTVAKRVAIDEHRKHERVSLVRDTPDGVDDRDSPEGRYEQKELLRAVVDEFATLPAAQRAAVLRIDDPKDYVRRHRARRRLLAVMEAFGAAISGVWVRLRPARRAVPLVATLSISVLAIATVHLTPRSSLPQDTYASRTTRTVARPPTPPESRPATTPSTRGAAPAQPRLPFEPPVQGRLATRTPAGEYWLQLRRNDVRRPLVCANLGSVGRSVCVNYPPLP